MQRHPGLAEGVGQAPQVGVHRRGLPAGVGKYGRVNGRQLTGQGHERHGGALHPGAEGQHPQGLGHWARRRMPNGAKAQLHEDDHAAL